MADELEKALDRLPWFIMKDGNGYTLFITRFYPTWVICYKEDKKEEYILKTGCCSLLECANQIFEKLKTEGHVRKSSPKRSKQQKQGTAGLAKPAVDVPATSALTPDLPMNERGFGTSATTDTPRIRTGGLFATPKRKLEPDYDQTQ
jgi:hypothetical protein